MKTLTKIIEMMLFNKELTTNPLAQSDRHFNNVKEPTKDSRRQTFKRRIGVNADGNLIKPSVLRKDTTASYKKQHPGQFGVANNRKIISPLQAQKMVDSKVSIARVVSNRKTHNKIQRWGISNSQKKHIEYHPNLGPLGTFFEVT